LLCFQCGSLTIPIHSLHCFCGFFPSFYFGYNISQHERYIVQKTGDWKPGCKLCYEFIRIAINYKVFQSRGWDQFCFLLFFFFFFFPFNFVMLPRWSSSIANLDTQIIKKISLYILSTYLNYFLKSGKNSIFHWICKNKNPNFCNNVKFRMKEEAGWDKCRVRPRVGTFPKKGLWR